MFGLWFYEIFYDLIYILYFAIPIALLVFWGIVMARYFLAKRKNKKAPGTFSDQQMKTRRLTLIVVSIVMGSLAAVAVWFLLVLYAALYHM